MGFSLDEYMGQGTKYNGSFSLDEYMRTGATPQSKLNLDTDFIKYTAEKYKTSWDYNELSAEDMERKSKGLMPLELEQSYTDSLDDAYLKQNGLPSYKNLEKYVEDYNGYIGTQTTLNEIKTKAREQFNELNIAGTLDDTTAAQAFYGVAGEYPEYAKYIKNARYEKTELDFNTTAEWEQYKLTKQDDPNTIYFSDFYTEYQNASKEQQAETANKAIDAESKIIAAFEAKKGKAYQYYQGIDIEDTVKGLLDNGYSRDDIQQAISSIESKLKIKVGGKMFEEALSPTTPESKEAAKQRNKDLENLYEQSDLNIQIQDIRWNGEVSADITDTFNQYEPLFRQQAKEAGYTDLEINNVLKKKKLNSYLSKDTDVKAYFANEVKKADPTATDEEIDLAYTAMSEEEKDLYQQDMIYSDDVYVSGGTQAVKTAMSVPFRAALTIAANTVNFADMIAGIGGDRDAWQVTKELNDAVQNWTEFGKNTHHKAISFAGDIGSEVLRMYATYATGQALGGAISGFASQSGVGVVLSGAAKIAQKAPFITNAMGGYFYDALQQGATRQQATLYGLVAGGFEGGLEALSTSEMFGKVYSQKILSKMGTFGKNVLASPAGFKVAGMVTSMIGEGFEEGASYALSGLAQMAIYNPEWKWNSKEFWSSVGMGAVIGVVGSAASSNGIAKTYYEQAMTEFEQTGKVKGETIDAMISEVNVENMPPAKVEARTPDAQMMDKETYIETTQKRDSAVSSIIEAEKVLEQTTIDYNAEVKKKSKYYEDTKAKQKAAYDSGNGDQISIATDQMKSAREELAIAKTNASRGIAKAQKEYRSTLANNSIIRDAAQRKLDDHDIAYVNKAAPQVAAPPAEPTKQPSIQEGQIEYAINPALRESTNAIRKAGRKLRQMFVTGQAEQERASKVQAKIDKGAVTMEEDIQLIRNAGGSIDFILKEGLSDRSGNVIDVSFTELVEPITGKETEVNNYLQHKHNIDRMSLEEKGLGDNKPVIGKEDGTPYTAQESAEIVQKYEQSNPEFKEFSDNLNSWWDKFMRTWMVESGRITEEAYNNMRQMYPNYIPTFRLDKGANNSSSSVIGNMVNAAQVIKGTKGSVEEIADVRDNFAHQINVMVRAVKKNDLFQNAYNFAENNPTQAAQFAKVVDGESDVEIESFDDLEIESFEQVKDGTYKLNLFKDGKKVQLQINEDMYLGFKDLLDRNYGGAVDKVIKVANAVTKVPKSLITGYNPLFAIRNIARDTQTGYANSIVNNPVKFVGGLVDAGNQMIQNTDRWKAFNALGGNRTTFYENNKGFVRSTSYERNTVQKVTDKVKDVFSFMGQNSEAITRFAEFNNYLDKYGDTPENRTKAMFAAADVTVNFSRSAPVTKALDSFTMYLNASVQGLDKMARQVKNRPIATTLKGSSGILIALALLKLLGNEDNPHYQNLSNYVKDSNFLIPNAFGQRDEYGNCTTFIKIPKSREYGIALVALAERAARVADGESPESAFKDFGDSIVTNFKPASPITGTVWEPLRATGVIGNATNQDYAGRDIIPQYMLDEDITEQKDSQTSEIAIMAGELFNIPPIYVDYLIKSYGGDFGDALIALTAKDAGSSSLANIAKSAFIADPLYQSGVANRFYDEMAKSKSEATKAKTQREALGLSILTDQEKEYKKYTDANKKIKALRKQERELLLNEKDTPARKAKIDDIRREINDIAGEVTNDN